MILLILFGVIERKAFHELALPFGLFLIFQPVYDK